MKYKLEELSLEEAEKLVKEKKAEFLSYKGIDKFVLKYEDRLYFFHYLYDVYLSDGKRKL